MHHCYIQLPHVSLHARNKSIILMNVNMWLLYILTSYDMLASIRNAFAICLSSFVEDFSHACT